MLFDALADVESGMKMLKLRLFYDRNSRLSATPSAPPPPALERCRKVYVGSALRLLELAVLTVLPRL